MKLAAENLSVGYAGNNPVFSGINFEAAEGEMIALLGVNGIGKSTLLKTIAGLQHKVEGNLLIGGREAGAFSAVERARLISLVLTEKLYIDYITVKEFISLGRSPHTNWLGNLTPEDETRIGEVIRLMKIQKLAPKHFNELSDGERQKVLIARALCQETPLMVLDEPTAFLDFRNKKEILAFLGEICTAMKKVVLLSTHDIDTVLEHCHKCWLMTEDGKFITLDAGENIKVRVKEILMS